MSFCSVYDLQCTAAVYISFVTTELYVALVGSIGDNTCIWLTAGSKIRSFDRYIKIKLKIMSLEVDNACDADTTYENNPQPTPSFLSAGDRAHEESKTY